MRKWFPNIGHIHSTISTTNTAELPELALTSAWSSTYVLIAPLVYQARACPIFCSNGKLYRTINMTFRTVHRASIDASRSETYEHPSAFLALPIEVRLLIYKHLFGNSRPHLRIDVSAYESLFYKASNQGSVLLTCRQCRDEASPLYETSFDHLVMNLDNMIGSVFPSGSSRWPSTNVVRYANTFYHSPTHTRLNTVLCIAPRSALLHKVIHLTIPCLDLSILRNLLQSTLLPALQIMELVHTHATILETVSTKVAPLDSLSEMESCQPRIFTMESYNEKRQEQQAAHGVRLVSSLASTSFVAHQTAFALLDRKSTLVNVMRGSTIY